MLKWLRRKPEQPVAGSSGPIEIRQPWARSSSTGDSQAGGFFTVTNTGNVPDRLIAASSPVARSTELHAIKVAGSNIAMGAVENGIPIHWGSTVTFQPRGYHLLMTGLAKPLSVGGTIDVTLVFEKAGNIDLRLKVEEPGPIGHELLRS